MDRKKEVIIVINALTDKEIKQIKQSFNPKKDHKIAVNINLVHVISSFPKLSGKLPAINVLLEDYFHHALTSLKEMGDFLEIPQEKQWLITGKLRTEVLKLATKIHSSLILAGEYQIKELNRSLFFKNIRQFTQRKKISPLLF